MGIPGGSDGKESACNAGDLGLIPGLGRSSGGGHSNPLQYRWSHTHKDSKIQKSKKNFVKAIENNRFLRKTPVFGI